MKSKHPSADPNRDGDARRRDDSPADLEALERDPLVAELREALQHTRAPDPGEAFHRSLTDDILRAVEERDAAPPAPRARRTLRDRLRALFSPLGVGALTAAAAAALLLIWFAPWSGSPGPDAPSPGAATPAPTASTDETRRDADEATPTLEQQLTALADEEVDDLDAEQLDELAILLERVPEQPVAADDDLDAPTWENELDDLDSETLAALDQELQSAFPATAGRRP